MSGSKVDVLEAMAGWCNESGIGALEYKRRSSVYAAVAALIEAGKLMLPRNVCLVNKNIPDSTEIPLLTTMGELRVFADAIAAIGPQA